MSLGIFFATEPALVGIRKIFVFGVVSLAIRRKECSIQTRTEKSLIFWVQLFKVGNVSAGDIHDMPFKVFLSAACPCILCCQPWANLARSSWMGQSD